MSVCEETASVTISESMLYFSINELEKLELEVSKMGPKRVDENDPYYMWSSINNIKRLINVTKAFN